MAKCPVCGMDVSEDTELKYPYKGKTYYFCSEGCLEEFKGNPEKYVVGCKSCR
jgi:YHS domain-containing protein